MHQVLWWILEIECCMRSHHQGSDAAERILAEEEGVELSLWEVLCDT